MTQLLQTKRILLRPPTQDDAEVFLQAVRESQKLHRPWVYPPDNHEAFTRYLRLCNADNFWGFLVLENQNNVLAGVVNIGQIAQSGLNISLLGFYGFSGMTGKGYLTDALNVICRYALNELRLPRLEVNVQSKNRRSIALVKRCGFKKLPGPAISLKVGENLQAHERWALVPK